MKVFIPKTKNRPSKMQTLYKITTPLAIFFFESENQIIVSVYNKQLESHIGKGLFEIIKYCEMKGYSIENIIL